MTSRRPVSCLGLLPLFGLLVAGCSGPTSTAQNVAGTATFDGKPIVYGQIEFIPDAAKQHTGPAGSAEIVDGKFDTKLGGQGIHFGAHQVRVTAYESRPPETTADETVAVEGPEPLFVGFTLDLDVSSPELTISVPAEAKGFNIFGSNKPKKRGNEP